MLKSFTKKKDEERLKSPGIKGSRDQNLLQIPALDSNQPFMKIKTMLLEKANDPDKGGINFFGQASQVKNTMTEELKILSEHLNKQLNIIKARPDLLYATINNHLKTSNCKEETHNHPHSEKDAGAKPSSSDDQSKKR
jgi:hypothetical protein